MRLFRAYGLIVVAIVTVAFCATARAQVGPGYALFFSRAQTQWVSVTAFGNMAPTNEVTVEFWQKVDLATNQYTATILPYNSGNVLNALVPWADGVVYWDFGNNGTGGRLSYTPPVSILGSWQHFAFVASQSGNYMKIFRNGVQEATKAGMTPFVRTNVSLLIGDFGGQVDEFRIWNTARSQAAIQSNINHRLIGTETNLVAYWRFDEGSGTNTADATGNGSLGVLTNGPAWVISGAPFWPDVLTGAATAITPTNATLNGSDNPGNLTNTAWFQWGATTSYGTNTPNTSLIATNAILAVASVLTNLTPNTTYHFRLMATNSVGSTNGADASFTTPYVSATVTTLAATGVSGSNATFNGSVNPNGTPAASWFQWGLDTAYGNNTATNVLGNGNTVTNFSQLLTNLPPGFAYHYRAVATNSAGLAFGQDQTFHFGPLTVTTLADNGTGSLRQAIANAYAVDSIVFATNGVITLTSGQLAINNNLTLIGPGATNLAVSGNLAGRVFYNNSGAILSISGVTIRDGRGNTGSAGVRDGNFNGTPGGHGDEGGGIYNLGTLSLTGCILSNNATGSGGTGGTGLGSIFGTRSSGPGGNGGFGGGLANYGTAALTGCTLNKNFCGNGGNGGSSSTYCYGGYGGNGGSGGACYNAGTLSLTNCTVNGNLPGNGGASGGSGGGPGGAGICGGVYNYGQGTIVAATITGNSDSGLWGYITYRPILRNSLIAQNAGPDISGYVTSGGHNLIGNGDGSSGGLTNGINADLVGTGAAPINPVLGPFANNGGPTFTFALLPGSPALEAGDDALIGPPFNLATDQRGLSRKSGTHVDIGAFEHDVSTWPPPSVTTLGASSGASSAVSGTGPVTFNGSANPAGLISTAWFQFGVTTAYGGVAAAVLSNFGTNTLPLNAVVNGLAAGIIYHYRLALTNDDGIFYGTDQTYSVPSLYSPGDLNGDGVVQQSELNTVLSNYWQTGALYMTNPARLAQGYFQFALTNDPIFSVLVSTNLSQWDYLGPAYQVYQFLDPQAASNAPQRFYRLRYP